MHPRSATSGGSTRGTGSPPTGKRTYAAGNWNRTRWIIRRGVRACRRCLQPEPPDNPAGWGFYGAAVKCLHRKKHLLLLQARGCISSAMPVRRRSATSASPGIVHSGCSIMQRSPGAERRCSFLLMAWRGRFSRTSLRNGKMISLGIILSITGKRRSTSSGTAGNYFF